MKSVYIHVSMTEKDKEKITQAAQESGIRHAATWCRMKLLEIIKQQADKKDGGKS